MRGTLVNSEQRDEAVSERPPPTQTVVAADELPNLPHVDVETIGRFALAKIKEAVLEVTGA